MYLKVRGSIFIIMCDMLSSVVIERIDNWSVQLSFDNDQLVANCTIGVSFLIVIKHALVAYTAIFSG